MTAARDLFGSSCLLQFEVGGEVEKAATYGAFWENDVRSFGLCLVFWKACGWFVVCFWNVLGYF